MAHRLKGKPISAGFAHGRAFVVAARCFEIARYTIDVERVVSEQERFRSALAGAVEDLELLRSRMAADLGEEGGELFAAHVAFLKDPQFIARIEERIERDRINAE